LPFNAFQMIQGIETLALRMDRICDNTLALARHLQNHPKVAWVNYAGLEDHPDHALVKNTCRAAPRHSVLRPEAGRGEDPRGRRPLPRRPAAVHALVNIGDAKSLATHPASTTHRQLNAEELAKAGVSEDMVRLSVGIEHIDDLRADLEQALNAA
jgi:O-acetylhomoserine (thiol)-lyase